MNIRTLALPGLLSAALVSSAFIGGSQLSADGPKTFAVDNSHSTVIFKIKHMGASWTYGRFNTVKGSFSIDDAALSKSSVSVEIASGSIDSNDAGRDKHLMSPDFFSVKQFPTITFKSTKVEKTASGYRATGELALHGAKKVVSFDFVKVGEGKHPKTKVGIVGYEGTLTIQRSDFDMKKFVDNGMVGNDVHLIIAVEGHES